MAIILSIETSTKVGSVALHVDGHLQLYHESFIEKSHSEHLAPGIGNLIAEAGLTPQQVEAVAVSKGPGSYTGLRIGVSVAKGFCYAHDIPLIAVDTLKSMAYEVKHYGIDNGLYCPMIDARRMEVYCEVFDDQLEAVGDIQAVVVEGTEFIDYLEKRKVYFFGNGAGKCKDVLQHENAVFINGIYPKARNIGYLASVKWDHGDFENLAYFEPYYLKEFVAKKPSGKNLV